MNKVLLTGRLTRDPELRSLASGSNVATFAVATNEFRGNGKERAEYHNVVVWDRLAQVCGQYLGKGQQVAIEGRLQTRQWDDDHGRRHCWVCPTQQAPRRSRSTGRHRARDRAFYSASDGWASAPFMNIKAAPMKAIRPPMTALITPRIT
jgi:single stranded DNA-binding protein